MSEAALIFAAGQGRRLGGRNKAALLSKGRPILERIVDTAQRAMVEEIVVVGSPRYADSLQARCRALGLKLIINDRAAEGMHTSISHGFSYALRRFRAARCWLWPVDTPLVASSTLVSLTRGGGAWVTPIYNGRGGHPVLVSRRVWPALVRSRGALEGARTIRKSLTPAAQQRVSVTDEMVLVDLDRPEDLQWLA